MPPGIFPLPIPDPSDDIPDSPFTFPIGRCLGHQYDLARQLVCIADTPFLTLGQVRRYLGV